ncbi:MAG: SLC13 family permease [Aquisalinus sp.]|nr:SLC13 family permease [Aquisalinus sp.]
MTGEQPQITAQERTQRIGLFLGPILALGMYALGAPDGLSQEGWIVACLTVLMAVWWVSEAIPIPATALLPLVILPATNVMPISEAAVGYANRVVILLMGGFIIAKSVERWNLHTRIALNIVARAGSNPAALIGGFMLASAILSMWISNTATTIMLAPIALSVARSVLGDDMDAPFTLAILLAIPYGASIGGLGTPVGTPTNLIVISYLEDQFGLSISFDQWMMLGLPVVALMLPAAWLVLTRWGLQPGEISGAAGAATVRERLTGLGRMSTPEFRVLVCFLLVAAFWMFRRPLNNLDLFGIQPFAGFTDHVIAIAGAILMFLVPSGDKQKRGALLDWQTAEQIPWGVLLLFGGGLSLASAISGTGLAAWLGDQMGGVATLPLIVIMLILVVFVIFATELTSNVATVSALLPVIGAIATGGEMNPLLLAAPAAMAASCAFMLPIATGPNAIVFATGHVPIRKMAVVGFRLNALGIILITLAVYLVAPRVFGV